MNGVWKSMAFFRKHAMDSRPIGITYVNPIKIVAIIPAHYNDRNWHVPFPDSKVRGANMGPIWGRQDPGGPQVGPMNFAIWDYYYKLLGKNIFIITSRRIHHAYIFGLQCMIIPQTKQMTKRYTLYIADSMNSMCCCVYCGARPQWWTYVLNNLIQCRLHESCLIHPGCCW